MDISRYNDVCVKWPAIWSMSGTSLTSPWLMTLFALLMLSNIRIITLSIPQATVNNNITCNIKTTTEITKQIWFLVITWSHIALNNCDYISSNFLSYFYFRFSGLFHLEDINFYFQSIESVVLDKSISFQPAISWHAVSSSVSFF